MALLDYSKFRNSIFCYIRILTKNNKIIIREKALQRLKLEDLLSANIWTAGIQINIVNRVLLFGPCMPSTSLTKSERKNLKGKNSSIREVHEK